MKIIILKSKAKLQACDSHMSPILRNTQLESRTSGGESRQCECAIFTYQDVNTYLSEKPKRAQDQIIQRSFEIIRMNGKERLVKTQ